MSERDIAAITAALRTPFDKRDIKQRPAPGGRQVDYLEGHTVINRLIEATNNQFDVRVLGLEQRGELAIATVELTIPGLGTRQHIGVQLVRDRDGEDIVKGAITDGLKKAATLFGVGLELYESEYGAAPSRPASRHQPSEDDNPWDVPPHPRSVEAQRSQRSTSGVARRATAKQVGFIKGLTHEQGISRETLEHTLQARYGHGLDELTAAEASEVIEALQSGQFAAPAERDTADQADEDEDERKRRGEAVRQAVEALAREYGWTMSRVTHWFRREFRMRRWSDLTDEAIDALHAEMERERAEVHGIPDGDEEGADA